MPPQRGYQSKTRTCTRELAASGAGCARSSRPGGAIIFICSHTLGERIPAVMDASVGSDSPVEPISTKRTVQSAQDSMRKAPAHCRKRQRGAFLLPARRKRVYGVRQTIRDRPTKHSYCMKSDRVARLLSAAPRTHNCYDFLSSSF